LDRGKTILERIDPRITFVSALPPPSGATTPIQGFSKERVELSWVWRLMLTLPSTIYELAAPVSSTIGLRKCGMAGRRHLPVRIDRLIRARIYDRSPIWVVFSADRQVARLVSEWAKHQPFRPLHVSTEGVSGAVPPSELTVGMFRQHCLDMITANEDRLSGLRPLVDQWREPEPTPAPFPFLGHQTVEPNQMCLAANGIGATKFIEHWRGASEDEFQDAIARSFHAVMDLHATATVPFGVSLMPPRPTIWLIAPAWHPNLRRRLLESISTTSDRVAVSDLANRIERQRAFVVADEPKILERLKSSPTALELHQTRRAELHLFFDAIGWALAGTAAGAWRMRPAINRVDGQVRQFAANIRADAGTPHSKVARLFAAMQSKLLQGVGEKAIQAIRDADWGVKVISDVPVEWLPVGRLPLGLHCDISRLTATPADLLLRQLETHEMLRLKIADFDEILLVSAFTEGHADDMIARLVDTVLDIKRVRLRVARVQTESEFIEAVNAYEGPLMIFDGHGSHPADEESHLVVGSDHIRIGALEERIRMPPIVILSACDTHAADRSTKTVSNAMLRLGARTVFATNLPVRFDWAAMMVGDIIRTIDAYLPLMPADIGRVVRWSEFAGAMVRAHFIMAVILQIVETGKSDEATMMSLAPDILLTARFKTGTEALQDLEQEIVGRGILDRPAFDALVRHVIATSDVIRYVQLGNPETILIGSAEDLSEAARKPFENMGPLTPQWKFDGDSLPGVVDMMEVVGQRPYGKWHGESAREG
jgi:hypothetical protein